MNLATSLRLVQPIRPMLAPGPRHGKGGEGNDHRHHAADAAAALRHEEQLAVAGGAAAVRGGSARSVTCVWYHRRMGARSRDSVLPSRSSESQMTYSQFIERFPDNDTCLEYLKERFFPDGHACPKCGKASKFHRIKGRS